jgi:4-hydroxybenzoate polyprenyltransferase
VSGREPSLGVTLFKQETLPGIDSQAVRSGNEANKDTARPQRTAGVVFKNTGMVMTGAYSEGRPASSGEWARTVLQVLRPRQWTKNLIAFAPILFAMKIHESRLVLLVSLCVVAFCLASSAVYVVNDILDRECDRTHPVKRKRPIASGKLSVTAAWWLAAVCAGASLLLSFAIRPFLSLIVLTYLALMLLYGLYWKHRVLLDVFSISAGFVLRAAGGAAAAMVPVSGWFLLCTSSGALFLALEKRRQELYLLKTDADSHRRTLNEYSDELINRMEAIIVPTLLTGYAFYSFQSWHGQWMMLTVPFVFYGIMRYLVLSVRRASTGSPEEVLLKDRPIQVTIVLWLATCVLVVYDIFPKAAGAVVPWFDSFRVFK